jgi:hypothetical protein
LGRTGRLADPLAVDSFFRFPPVLSVFAPNVSQVEFGSVLNRLPLIAPVSGNFV